MASVTFKGNIGKVRGLAFSQDGKPRFSFSVAEGHGRFDKQTNQWQDTGTTWRNVTAFGKQAEDLASVIQEGQKQRVVVAGREETREYEANGETRTSLDVIADYVGIIPRADVPAPSQPQQSGGWGQPAPQSAPAQDPWSGGQQQAAGEWAAPQSQGNPPF